ncbi:MAG: hypothetical protein ACI9VO_000239, partial [Colwellia sp.]
EKHCYHHRLQTLIGRSTICSLSVIHSLLMLFLRCITPFIQQGNYRQPTDIYKNIGYD